MYRRIDISHKTVIFIAVFVLGLWITYLILDLLLLLFVALILTSALNPVVDFFVKLKFPRAVGIMVSYILILTVVAILVAIILPPLIEQSTKLFAVLPSLLTEQFNLSNFDQTIFQSEIASFSRNIYAFVLGAFNNFLTIILLLVVTFYLLLEQESLKHRAAGLFGSNQNRVKNLISKIEEKLGAWMRGQLLLTIIIGVVSYVGLLALQIPYAPPLAVLAGIMEIVPVIGPIIAALPAIAIAATESPVLAGAVAAMYVIIQQLENNLIVPQVMKRAVGLNPLVVILAIAVGGRLLGVAGALLAVPITVVIQIIVLDFLKEHKEK